MIKIIKNGKDKVFYTKCSRCATEFTYTYEDIEMGYPETALIKELEQPLVECPVCETTISANMITKEEIESFNNTCPMKCAMPCI